MRLWLPDPVEQLRQRRPLPPRDEDQFRLAEGTLVKRDHAWTSVQGQVGFCYRGTRDLTILATSDPTDHWDYLLHVSLSYPDHDPPWKVIRAVRDAFYPNDCDVIMVLPRAADYVNIHSHCFHLWQAPERWGMR